MHLPHAPDYNLRWIAIIGGMVYRIDPELEYAEHYFEALLRRIPVPCLGRLAWQAPATIAELDLGPLGRMAGDA